MIANTPDVIEGGAGTDHISGGSGNDTIKVTDADYSDFKKEYRKSLEGGLSVAKNLAKKPNDSLWFDWEPYMGVLWWPKVETGFNKKKFNKLGKGICKVPNSFSLGSQASKIFEERLKMNNGEVER